MSTIETVELTIVTVILSLFFLLACAFALQMIRLVLFIKRLTRKAESFIDSAQSAAETITRMGAASKHNFPFVRIISQLFDTPKKRGK